MVIIWMIMHEKPDKKYDNEKLREATMSLPKVIKEIAVAAGKLKYELFHIRENSIALMKIEPKEKKDIFLMTIVGTAEEIITIQKDERIKKFLK